MIPRRFRPKNFRQSLTYLIAGILIAAVTLYLALPILALFLRITPEKFFSALQDPDVTSALWLSLVTTIITLIIVIAVGTPFAYFHSRFSYPGKVIVDTLIDLPLVLPPAVAGVALLMLYGRAGLLGRYADMFGISIAFTTLAVIMAQIFVASPFFLRQAKSLFEQLDPAYEQTARTLGASSLRTMTQVTLPMTAGGLVSGAVMTFGRALGEFGATIMFAGNLPGVTQTMPLAVYVGMESDLWIGLTISILLVIISFTIMIIVRLIQKREADRA
ncbi:ABC transporter permease [Methanoregula sp.]|uniref:ABC transporter permease n=1 Tax=Methanoregula sp. TaxID=2052170 RepID=UPI002CF8905F|nr:ABC transporter permease [Methanoregula sp.]HVP95938.1 ABC transporter permease [Methanoregula sp.]